MPGSNLIYSTGEYFDSPELSITPSTLPNTLQSVQLTTSSFDPNAGKQAAYDTRWNNYLANLGKTQNKINVKKARKYFDSQFELDWNNEAASRELDFVSNQATQSQNDLISRFRAANLEAARLSLELDALDYKAAGYTYDTASGKWNKPLLTTPAVKPVTPPKTVSNTVELPSALAKKNGSTNNNLVGSYYPDSNIPTDNPLFDPKNFAKESDKKTSEVSNVPVFKGDDSYYNKVTLNRAIENFFRSYYRNLGKVVDSDNPNVIDGMYTNIYDKYYLDALKQYEDDGGLFGYNVFLPGRIFTNRFTRKKMQQGGTMNNQEELQKAFMAYLIQDAATLGIQLQSEQDLQAYAQLLGEEGIQAKYQEFMLKMQGGVKARLGAKLEYYRKLKGVCPDGSQPTYFKKGGRICTACLKALKGKKMNPVEEFKNKRKLISENDTIHSDNKVYDLTGKHKLYPKLTNDKYRKLSNRKQSDVDLKDQARKNACGSKMKKK